MEPKENSRQGKSAQPKPMAMVGAGPLVSTVWKLGDEQRGWRYRFNLFRQLARRGHVSQLFQPDDLIHLVKLTQVLAAVLADDGCISAGQRQLLQQLAAQLDDITQCWNLSDDRSDSSTSHRSSQPPRKGRHGDSTHS